MTGDSKCLFIYWCDVTRDREYLVCQETGSVWCDWRQCLFIYWCDVTGDRECLV